MPHIQAFLDLCKLEQIEQASLTDTDRLTLTLAAATASSLVRYIPGAPSTAPPSTPLHESLAASLKGRVAATVVAFETASLVAATLDQHVLPITTSDPSASPERRRTTYEQKHSKLSSKHTQSFS